MSRVHKADRAESPFEVHNNAVELAKVIRELDYIRNFGYKMRHAKIPGNWDQWSDDSKAKWMQREADRIERLRTLDEGFLARKRENVEEDLRKLLISISSANSYKWCKCAEEANRRLLLQDRAIEACWNLRTDLQDIMHTLPIDKNWMTQVDPLIEKELALLNGWKKSDSDMRKAVFQSEEKRGREIIRIGFEEAATDKVLRAVYAALGIETAGSS